MSISQLRSSVIPDRAVSVRSGSTPASIPSSRTRKASSKSSSTVSPRNTARTPSPALIPRGSRSFSPISFTRGSAPKASAVPSRKGKHSGSRNVPPSHSSSPVPRRRRTVPVPQRNVIPPFRQRVCSYSTKTEHLKTSVFVRKAFLLAVTPFALAFSEFCARIHS